MRMERMNPIHLWIEAGGRVRARVIRSDDVTRSEAVTAYASTPAEVVALTQHWLDAVMTRP